MSDDDDVVVAVACWQFNEAVSLLRSARRALGHVDRRYALCEEIDDSLPEIDAALKALAERVSS